MSARDEARRRTASLSVSIGAYGELSAYENLLLAEHILRPGPGTASTPVSASVSPKRATGKDGSVAARPRIQQSPETSRIELVLDRVGLSGREGTPLDTFSAGMKQRFALARLSLLQRDLVLLDEPEAHLDAEGLTLLRELIQEWKSRGAAILCATHAPERFRDLEDLEIHLVGGSVEVLKGDQ